MSEFRESVEKDLKERVVNKTQFPSEKEVFVFIVQYFVSKKEYSERDVDNFSKTILDVMGGVLYKDDAQVSVLLTVKRMANEVSKNFLYVALKELRSEKDIKVLKVAGIERSVHLFNELKRQGSV